MSRYVSCEWIENGMDFDVGVYGSNIMMCCYVSCPGGGNIMLKTDFHGEQIDWKEFWRIKNEYRNIQKSGGTVEKCKGCLFLKENDWEEGNRIKSVIFDHFTHCNCACLYCYTEEDKQKYNSLKSYNVLPTVKDMYERGILQPGGQIGFGGGEPTILEEFEELINYLLERGFDNINVPSSGIKYSPVIEKGISLGKLTVLNSIDAGCRETYKTIKQIDAYERVVENMKRYAAVKHDYLSVTSKYIIYPGYNDTKEEVDKWLNTCRESKIESLCIALENIWLKEHRHSGNEDTVDLIGYMFKKAKQMDFKGCRGENHVEHLLMHLND